MSRPHGLAIGLGLLLAAALAASLMLGSEPIPPARVAAVLLGSESGPVRDIVIELRLPRASAATACGALLGLAGVLLQVLLRNPLADPYVLGISGGASVGVLTAALLGAGQALSAAAGLAGS